VLLAIIFILEIAAGALAYAYRGKVSIPTRVLSPKRGVLNKLLQKWHPFDG